ncbi:hypothetical protein HPT25_26290 [Bacillus sp. BRMEA1]|uniref:hypothetical protein n=1 Tax=Neobacillus endophyticus TaxID=2738405 RepID=UPI001565CF46|nr:hypothetical protein [Neobacillus endophyticus]NRD80841.1 hypothetical protein [Neobacillus endophyticus]
MNKTLSTFLGIAVSVVAIGAFLFGVCYNMTGTQATSYQGDVTGVHSKLPTP